MTTLDLTGTFRRYDQMSGQYVSEPVPRDFLPDYAGDRVQSQIHQFRQTMRRRLDAEIKKQARIVVPSVNMARPISKPYEYGLKEILWCIAVVTGISLNDLKSPRRATKYADARFIYYTLAKAHTLQSLIVIGRECGGRDRTTVIYGLDKVERLRSEYQARIEAAEAKLFERELLEQPKSFRARSDNIPP